LNSKVPFSESDITDQPASLYATMKKAGEEITHKYNHIYELSIIGLHMALGVGLIWLISFLQRIFFRARALMSTKV
jgi:hypothetical protein